MLPSPQDLQVNGGRQPTGAQCECRRDTIITPLRFALAGPMSISGVAKRHIHSLKRLAQFGTETPPLESETQIPVHLGRKGNV
jgi:hypothetical protein